MSAMPPKKLLSMWLNEKIPSERTMGQVLQPSGSAGGTSGEGAYGRS